MSKQSKKCGFEIGAVSDVPNYLR